MITHDEKSVPYDSNYTNDYWIDFEIELENFLPSVPPWKGTRESSLHYFTSITHDTNQSIQSTWEEDI